MNKNKDDEILFHLNRCNLMATKHLKKVIRNNSWLNESLRRMERQKKVYFRDLGRFGGFVWASYNISRRYSFDHDLPLADIYISLHKTGRLIDWQQPKDRYENKLNEDARFDFATGDGSLSYYLEFETGKNNWSLIDSKFARYLSKRTSDRFHVLFVLKDERLKKAEQMTARAEQFLDKDTPSAWKLFLFTTAERLVSNPLGQICNIAYTPNLYPLAPDLIK